MQRFLLALVVLILAACDDPAPVGVDLVDAQSGEPTVLDLASGSLTAATYDEATGNVSRALFGIVDDPELGTTEALAYLDFVSTGVNSSAFESNPVTAASLLLATDYVYGDSLSDISVVLRKIEDGWIGTGVTSDTTLQVGPIVAESVQNYRTSTLEIPLPAEWIAEWDTFLRGSTFDDLFHGFEVSTTSRTSVLGVGILGSAIRAVAGGDTVHFSASRSLTRFTDAGEVQSGASFQDGKRRTRSFAFPERSGDDVALLNRGIIRLAADTSLATSGPAGFARPTINQLQLDWISKDGTRTAIAIAARQKTHFDFESIQLHDSLSVYLLGRSHVDHLEVRVPDAANGISVLRFPTPPRALLTVTPIQ